ncbi:MAG: hypothetical protein NTW08_06265 [Gammaproteobacteria bacterium]|nr:hypothetical protein [Gammaproteobacteria bacterium]
MRIILPILTSLLILCGTSFADEMPPPNPLKLPPPPPLAPRTQTLAPLSGTDSATTTYPESNMDTIQTQSLGTSGDNHPQSHPIPLDQVPEKVPNDPPNQW